MRFLPIALLVALSGRGDTASDSLPGALVPVDGTDHLVRRLMDGSYQALPNSYTGITALTFERNKTAIEIFTGCELIDATARSGPGGWTIAMVECGA